MSKADLRTRVRAARTARSAGDREAAAAALAAHVHALLPSAPGTIAVYLSLPTEPGTDPLIDAARGAGHRVLVPRISGAALEWVGLTSDTSLATGPLGIREPVGVADADGALATVDLLLLPGLAVDRGGTRLGQGGGYYDRALAQVPTHAQGGPLRVIVLFDDEVLDTVPSEPHDCRVDAVLTPAGIARFG